MVLALPMADFLYFCFAEQVSAALVSAETFCAVQPVATEIGQHPPKNARLDWCWRGPFAVAVWWASVNSWPASARASAADAGTGAQAAVAVEDEKRKRAAQEAMSSLWTRLPRREERLQPECALRGKEVCSRGPSSERSLLQLLMPLEWEVRPRGLKKGCPFLMAPERYAVGKRTLKEK